MRKIRTQDFVLLALALLIMLVVPAASTGLTGDEENNISIYEQFGPGVVNVTSVVIQRDFLHNPIPREGAGSGSIIDKDGHILTNHHVIQDSTRLEVTLSDGSKWPAKLVGTDPDHDLAVIKIDVPSDKLTVISMADSSELNVGQMVLAIGNPFGLGQTLTTGIISSLGRSIRSERGILIEELIQTDAAINPGNSGGPLLDSTGKIIGINTAIISPTGASVGVGFAVPINAAKRILPELIAKGYVTYPWLGASVYPLIPEFSKAVGLSVERGALIGQVVSGAPADKAGLKGGDRQVQVGNSLVLVGGDVIVEMDGQPITGSDDLIRRIRDYRPGDKIELKVLRDNEFRRFEVTLGEKPT